LTKAAALCLSRRSVAKEEVPRLGAKTGPLASHRFLLIDNISELDCLKQSSLSRLWSVAVQSWRQSQFPHQGIICLILWAGGLRLNWDYWILHWLSFSSVSLLI